MKKFFTLAVSILALAANIHAQSVNDVSFIDKDGNVIEDGTTFTVSACEVITEDDFQFVELPSGISLRVNTGGVVPLYLQFTVIRIDNGALQICFPTNCYSITKPQLATGTASDNITGTRSLQTEWTPEAVGASGEAEIMLRVKYVDDSNNDIGTGPTITVHFVYDDNSANVADITADNTEVARYSLSGQRLTAPQRGVNIVKTTDGTIRKVIVE